MDEARQDTFNGKCLYGIHLLPGLEGGGFPEVTVNRGTSTVEITGPDMEPGESREVEIGPDEDIIVLVVQAVEEAGP